MVERADTERADADLLEPLIERMHEVERIGSVAALRDENAERRVAEASDREGQDPLRRHIEPLHVVHRNEHGRSSGERAEIRREGTRQREPVRPLISGGLEPCRDRERLPLWPGEVFGDLGERSVDEVAEPSQGERQLRLDTPRQQNSDAGLLRCVDRASPQNCLPDPRLAANGHTTGASSQIADEPQQSAELDLPTDELESGCDGHPLIVPQPTRRFQDALDAKCWGFRDARAKADGQSRISDQRPGGG